MDDSTTVLTGLALTRFYASAATEAAPIARAWDAFGSAIHEAGLRVLNDWGTDSHAASSEVAIHVERGFLLEQEFGASQVCLPASVVSDFQEIEQRIMVAPITEVVAFLGLVPSVTAAFATTVQAAGDAHDAGFSTRLRLLIRSADFMYDAVLAYGTPPRPSAL